MADLMKMVREWEAARQKPTERAEPLPARKTDFARGVHFDTSTKPETQRVVEPRINTGEILVSAVPMDGKRDAPGTKHCRTHPTNVNDWWLRGDDWLCAKCHPNPATLAVFRSFRKM
jgi:hypothetical protein